MELMSWLFKKVFNHGGEGIFFIFEILILIFVYILATYISNAYETTLSAIPFSSIYTTNLNYATTFILKLPLIVTITGVIMMIIGYAGIPKTREEEVAGFWKWIRNFY